MRDDPATLLLEFNRRVWENRRLGAADPNRLYRIKTLYLVNRGDPPTMKELADCLNITPPSTTIMVNKLVKAGYIERRADPQDRRTIRLALTDPGKQKLEEAVSEIRARVAELTKVLTGEEKKYFIKILSKINHT